MVEPGPEAGKGEDIERSSAAASGPGKGEDIEMAPMDSTAAPSLDAFGRRKNPAPEDGDSFKQEFAALKREGGWKTCLIVTLVIVCAVLLTALIAAMLEQAKYIGFANRDCATAPQPWLPFSPAPKPAPAPAPPPREIDRVLIACSNNGYLFDGEDTCECFPCFSGARCEVPTPPNLCMDLDVNGGSPEIFVEYWAQHPMSVSIKMSHRIGYGPTSPSFGDPSDIMYRPPGKVAARLEAAIRGVHKLVNNADPTGMYLVFGDGSTPLISVAQMVRRDSSEQGTCDAAGAACELPKLKIWGQKPYYSGYNPPVYPEVLEFAGDRPKDDMATEDHVIEYITSPNNPDGEIRERVLEGRDAVWDSAYYWPTYTAMQGPQDLRGDDMSLWTLSKLTGHASSRVGWAWVKDAEVARKMQSIACPIGCPLQSQMFAAAALEHVIETKGHIFEWGRAQFEARWQQLRELFQSSSSFQIENPFPADGRNHTPPYLWFKCTKGSALEGHTNTNGQPSLGVMLRDNGIAARPGEYFGTGQEDHARISLYVATSTFDLFIRKMRVIFAAVDAP